MEQARRSCLSSVQATRGGHNDGHDRGDDDRDDDHGPPIPLEEGDGGICARSRLILALHGSQTSIL